MFHFKRTRKCCAGKLYKGRCSSRNNILDKQCTHFITKKRNDCSEAAVKLLESSEKTNQTLNPDFDKTKKKN